MPKQHSEVVIEQTLGHYRLPDNAVDIQEWLKDGTDIYNLFTMMHPLFFQMLEALGGKFSGSAIKAANQRENRTQRLILRAETIGKFGEEGYDHLYVAELREVPPSRPEISKRDLLDILAQIEFVQPDSVGRPATPFGGVCPSCRMYEQFGHSSICKLAEALKGNRVEQRPADV